MSGGYAATKRAARTRARAQGRATFLVRVYNHLFATIAAFVALEWGLFQSGLAGRINQLVAPIPWPAIFAVYLIVAWFASRVAWRSRSLPAQYAALVAFVLAKAFIFVPMLSRAERYAPGTIRSAAVLTLLCFAGLTAIAFITRKDFSFLRGFLRWGFFVALLTIVAGWLFGFRLGTWFSLAMIAMAGGSVLYDTSKILRRYRHNRHVGAALSLFSAVAMMFWYVLRIASSRR